jgi:hypothetical protein
MNINENSTNRFSAMMRLLSDGKMDIYYPKLESWIFDSDPLLRGISFYLIINYLGNYEIIDKAIELMMTDPDESCQMEWRMTEALRREHPSPRPRRRTCSASM